MDGSELYPRFSQTRLCDALGESPVVLIHGPRQSGKTTLAKLVGDSRGYAYLTLDDDVIRHAAENDPTGFVDDLPEKVIIDEVQKVPALFGNIKRAVDTKRVPGRFLLTGSTNVFLIPTLSDSLVGRMEIVRLHPLAQCEIERRRSGFLDALFGKGFTMGSHARLREELAGRIVSGGYPVALARRDDRRRSVWYRDYIETIVQRDVRELGRIRSLDVLPRLLSLAAGQTARLLNISDLSGPFHVSRPTVGEYVTLLEQVFLIDELPSWHTNRLKRLVKTPKVHIADTGVGCALLDVDTPALRSYPELYGQLVETFVYQELLRMASWSESRQRFFHLRDKDGVEVDIVVEGPAGRIAGVEVKSGATVRDGDFRGIRKLQSVAGKRFAAGVVLYDGEHAVSFGENQYAVPIRALWETTCR